MQAHYAHSLTGSTDLLRSSPLPVTPLAGLVGAAFTPGLADNERYSLPRRLPRDTGPHRSLTWEGIDVDDSMLSRLVVDDDINPKK